MVTKVTFHIRKEADFSNWFSTILAEAEIVDIRYNVKGFIVYRPWGMRIVRGVLRTYESELEQNDYEPVHFPLVIPESNLAKEAEHVKGFFDQVFWVTHAGRDKLDEPLSLRPTSETAIYPLFALWISSHRDLPVRVYQNGTVFRHETEATRPMIRGREFIWIEGHTVHDRNEGALAQNMQDIEIARRVISKHLGIPFLVIERPFWDKFPGADRSFAFDAVMPDGKIMQIGTTHLLGQKFSKPFEIKFNAREGGQDYAYQTCYGPGIARIAATVVALHGDNNGLVLPFEVAPVQVVIVPIFYSDEEKLRVFKKCEELKSQLAQQRFRVHFDSSEDSPGEKFYFWEMKGVPARIEIGPREVEESFYTVFRRDLRNREKVRDKELISHLRLLDQDILRNLSERSEKFLWQSITTISSRDELVSIYGMARGFIKLSHCGREVCAGEIKSASEGLELRGYGLDEKPSGRCAWCGNEAMHVAYFGRAY